ncbi:hypothetical protein ACIQUQ_30260 [Streptomyces sp. NPDC101118]|uniref:NucA/NucB deoxyribonuclease domain-containing protein n=1 Tax=Streptomyces sp. NPDC101118 TaxID=3366109 RepID=UPI0037F815A2
MTVPDWCAKAVNKVQGRREAVCLVSPILYTTYRTIDGVRKTVGEARFDIVSYNHSSASSPRWTYQAQVNVKSGWGEAMSAGISGRTTVSGLCRIVSATFPLQPLSPAGSTKNGEATYATTATWKGAIGRCATIWAFTLTNPGYPDAVGDLTLDEFRCDTATPGRTSTGCVVPWYASALIYRKSSTPQLASHITRAQGSGLPGATFARPLHRSLDPDVWARNRKLACADAPSISGKSCDEYPIASAREGLGSGGQRRSFPGCSLPRIPSRTGGTGASVCMISRTEQSVQGGTNTQFFRRWRYLEGDPFRVLIRP